MDGPDRDLVRAMLERRAASPMPPTLLEETMRAAAGSRPPGAGDGRHRPGGVAGPSTSMRVAAIAAICVVVVTGIGLGAAGFLRDPDGAGASPSSGSGAAGTPGASPGSSPVATASVAPTPRVVPEGVAPDTIAVVTDDGAGLRVRTEPGTGDPSTRLSPLLPAGTRLFVVEGPVEADGLAWYEVLADHPDTSLFGWVAAGKDGEQWIRASDPRCPREPEEWEIAAMGDWERLVCFGGARFEVATSYVGLNEEGGIDTGVDTGSLGGCAWIEIDTPCTRDPEWLVPNVSIGGEEWGAMAAAAPDISGTVAAAAERVVAVTLEVDPPEAGSCRVHDDDGRDAIPRDEAVLVCRMTMVIRDAVVGDAEQLPPDSMAWIAVESVPVWSDPRIEPSVVESTFTLDTEVYVDARWPEDSPAEWYAVLSRPDGGYSRYGWVPALVDGRSTLESWQPDCVPMTSWGAFVELGPLARLACVDGDPVTLDAWVWQMQDANPAWSAGCTAWSGLPHAGPDATCEARPAWLASFSGIAFERPGDMEMFVTLDPSSIDRSRIPTTRTWVKVTGQWEWPTSDECRVVDAATGVDLLPPGQAAIYCRATFVVTGIGEATTSP